MKYLECEKRWVFALLIFVAGLYGAYTLVVRGGVFCNAQTGNIALLAVSVGQGNWSKAGYYLIPMSAYLVGIMVSETIPRHIRRFRIRWDTLLTAIEILVVVALGFIPASAPHQICQVIINFICAMQYNTFRQAEGVAMASTFCTSHMRAFGTALSRMLFQKEKRPDDLDKIKSHGLMILCFALGVIAGTVLCRFLGVYAIWFALIFLSILFAELLRADLAAQKEPGNMTSAQ